MLGSVQLPGCPRTQQVLSPPPQKKRRVHNYLRCSVGETGGVQWKRCHEQVVLPQRPPPPQRMCYQEDCEFHAGHSLGANQEAKVPRSRQARHGGRGWSLRGQAGEVPRVVSVCLSPPPPHTHTHTPPPTHTPLLLLSQTQIDFCPGVWACPVRI